MEKRKILRLDINDFLEIRPLSIVGKKVKAQTKNMTYAGICFSSEMQWRRGDVLLIDYFLPNEFDSVKLKVLVVWSEFIDFKNGYFCGAEIIEIEEGKQEIFFNYYFQRLKEIE